MFKASCGASVTFERMGSQQLVQASRCRPPAGGGGEGDRLGLRPLVAWPVLRPTFHWRPAVGESLGAWTPCFITDFSLRSPDYPQSREMPMSLKLRASWCTVMMSLTSDPALRWKSKGTFRC